MQQSKALTKNRTRADARRRVIHAQMGAFADATPEYLEALRQHLLAFASQVFEEIAILARG